MMTMTAAISIDENRPQNAYSRKKTRTSFEYLSRFRRARSSFAVSVYPKIWSTGIPVTYSARNAEMFA